MTAGELIPEPLCLSDAHGFAGRFLQYVVVTDVSNARRMMQWQVLVAPFGV